MALSVHFNSGSDVDLDGTGAFPSTTFSPTTTVGSLLIAVGTRISDDGGSSITSTMLSTSGLTWQFVDWAANVSGRITTGIWYCANAPSISSATATTFSPNPFGGIATAILSLYEVSGWKDSALVYISNAGGPFLTVSSGTLNPGTVSVAVNEEAFVLETSAAGSLSSFPLGQTPNNSFSLGANYNAGPSASGRLDGHNWFSQVDGYRIAASGSIATAFQNDPLVGSELAVVVRFLVDPGFSGRWVSI